MLSAVFYLARVALAGIRLLFQHGEHENEELIDLFIAWPITAPSPQSWPAWDELSRVEAASRG